MSDRSPSSDPGLLLLISLSGGPKHGHAMLLDVASFAGMRLGPGTLYGALSRLEEDGLVEALPLEGRRRPYRLTNAGLAALRGRLTGLSAAVSTGLARVGSP
ncbi:MAG: PadR family transcriptional regulator [Chloroflexota bacterium]|nr:PadR family transcriptional regulator [Chloroflexota bacterium]